MIFFTQVVKQTLRSKVTIECSPAKHSVTVSGNICDVSVVVKSMRKMIQHVVVPVHVDKVMVHFINTLGRKYNTKRGC